MKGGCVWIIAWQHVLATISMPSFPYNGHMRFIMSTPVITLVVYITDSHIAITPRRVVTLGGFTTAGSGVWY